MLRKVYTGSCTVGPEPKPPVWSTAVNEDEVGRVLPASDGNSMIQRITKRTQWPLRGMDIGFWTGISDPETVLRMVVQCTASTIPLPYTLVHRQYFCPEFLLASRRCR